MYKSERKIFFDKTKSRTSYEKAEKVVKEPKKPITKKYLMKFSGTFLLYPREIKYPIINDPVIFTINVA